ncbi:hypothetical protein EW145_g1612, partial [Phellinidium pouzarii]
MRSYTHLKGSSSMSFEMDASPGPSEKFQDEDVFPRADAITANEPLHLESPYKHKNAKVTQDSVLGYVKMTNIEDFEIHYLQEIKIDWPETLIDIQIEYIKSLPPSLSEANMYPLITKLLTKISLLVCKDPNRCLAFYDVSTSGCLGDFEGSGTKPDIV